MQSYEDIVKLMVSEKRFHHSQCVAWEAKHLAATHGVDIKRAYIAAILHDVCKDLPQSALLQMIVKAGIICDNVTFRQPQVWHGIAGAVFARQQLGITDQEVLDAIRYHTTGRAGMTSLEQIVYVADLTSEDRDFPGVDKLRRLAEESLDNAMLESLSYIVEDFAKQCKPLCPDTYAAYNEYCARTRPMGPDPSVWETTQDEGETEKAEDYWPNTAPNYY